MLSAIMGMLGCLWAMNILLLVWVQTIREWQQQILSKLEAIQRLETAIERLQEVQRATLELTERKAAYVEPTPSLAAQPQAIQIFKGP